MRNRITGLEAIDIPAFSIITEEAKHYYDEPHRAYHNWDHIFRMLLRWHTNKKVMSKIPQLSMVQMMAILFHDISYVPGSKTNEEDSFLIFEIFKRRFKYSFFKLGIGTKEVITIHNIIMSTKSPHVPLCKEAELVVDLDMLGFSFSRPHYEENNRLIEKEFSFLPKESWRLGRLGFLQSMAKRKPFYYTPALQHLDRAAYKNVRQDMHILI
jgi:predicted metal-dependent HD superfamily phosphohydrolase